jgi:hypothetical protein
VDSQNLELSDLVIDYRIWSSHDPDFNIYSLSLPFLNPTGLGGESRYKMIAQARILSVKIVRDQSGLTGLARGA